MAGVRATTEYAFTRKGKSQVCVSVMVVSLRRKSIASKLCSSTWDVGLKTTLLSMATFLNIDQVPCA